MPSSHSTISYWSRKARECVKLRDQFFRMRTLVTIINDICCSWREGDALYLHRERSPRNKTHTVWNRWGVCHPLITNFLPPPFLSHSWEKLLLTGELRSSNGNTIRVLVVSHLFLLSIETCSAPLCVRVEYRKSISSILSVGLCLDYIAFLDWPFSLRKCDKIRGWYYYIFSI